MFRAKRLRDLLEDLLSCHAQSFLAPSAGCAANRQETGTEPETRDERLYIALACVLPAPLRGSHPTVEGPAPGGVSGRGPWRRLRAWTLPQSTGLSWCGAFSSGYTSAGVGNAAGAARAHGWR